METRLVIRVAGHASLNLIFSPASCCGEIDNGVSFQHEDEGGGWVISYEDLLRMTKLAAKWRAEHGNPPNLREYWDKLEAGQ